MWSTARLLAVVALAAPTVWGAGATVQAPAYTAASIVNSASYVAGAIAPNTICSIFGTNLSYGTHALTSHDLQNGALPITLVGVTVYVGGLGAGLYYVSPTQINFLVPYNLLPGPVTIVVVRESLAGPQIKVNLLETAPALFRDADGRVVAAHSNGSLITDAAPAQPGEWIVLYAVGLGRTLPDSFTNEVAISAQPILKLKDLSVLLDSVSLNGGSIYYAGVTPGFAGLYQVNLHLPDQLGADPQIKLAIGTALSEEKVRLPAH